MKVIGLGSPYDVQIRFDASEVDVLVDVLRERRADATRDAASIYATTPSGETEAVDDRHNRLRAVEALLMQLEVGRRLPLASRAVGRPRDALDAARHGEGHRRGLHPGAQRRQAPVPSRQSGHDHQAPRRRCPRAMEPQTRTARVLGHAPRWGRHARRSCRA